MKKGGRKREPEPIRRGQGKGGRGRGMKGVEMGTGQSAYDIVHSGTHALKYAGKAKGR